MSVQILVRDGTETTLQILTSPRAFIGGLDLAELFSARTLAILLVRNRFRIQRQAVARGPTCVHCLRAPRCGAQSGSFTQSLNRPNMPNSEVEEPRTLVKSKLRSDELDEEEGFLIASCSRARRKVNISQCFD